MKSGHTLESRQGVVYGRGWRKETERGNAIILKSNIDIKLIIQRNPADMFKLEILEFGNLILKIMCLELYLLSIL